MLTVISMTTSFIAQHPHPQLNSASHNIQYGVAIPVAAPHNTPVHSVLETSIFAQRSEALLMREEESNPDFYAGPQPAGW